MRIVSPFLATDFHHSRHRHPLSHVRRYKLLSSQPAPPPARLLRLCLALLMVATGPSSAHTFDTVTLMSPNQANAAPLAISSSGARAINQDGLADAISGAPLESPSPSSESPAVPNIVVIMTDDLNVNALNDGIANGWMPNLKNSIIDHGITFTHSFLSNSLCSPSRATLLTGQTAHNHGVVHNSAPGGGFAAFNDTSTLPIWLQNAGYRTGLVGKYLNGYGLSNYTYVPPGWDDWQAAVDTGSYNYSISDNGVLVTYGSESSDFYTDVYAARAVDFIRESDSTNDAQPFFLEVTPNAPHLQGGISPCTTNVGRVFSILPAQRHTGIADNVPLPQFPSFNEADVSDKPTWLKNNHSLLKTSHIECLTTIHRDRVEAMMAVDDLIGRIVSELQTLGELADTVIVFTSDNGYLMGEHRAFQKVNPYEESIRAPLYVRGPGVASQQSALQMVTNVDLAPTLVELAQATAGLVTDGRSVVPILRDPGYAPWRSCFLVEHTNAGGNDIIPTYAAVRAGQYKWVEYMSGERELYDLEADPYELTSQHNNVAYRSVRNTLKQMVSILEDCSGSTCWQ